MHGFIHILLVLLILLVKGVYQNYFLCRLMNKASHHKHFLLLSRQNFSMLILNGMAFTIDILIELTLISSFLNAAKINENACICCSKSEITIAKNRIINYSLLLIWIIILSICFWFDWYVIWLILLTKKQETGQENKELAFWTQEWVKYI